MEEKIKSVVFIGSGNVSTRLALALQKAGINIAQIYGRTEERALKLAEKSGTIHTSNLNEIKADADLYILSISDDALQEICLHLNIENQLVVHTSGTTSMEVLNRFENHGVFYPLQTFSSEKEISFENIPFCLEASSFENLEKLKELASLLSTSVHLIDSAQRKILHTGAVFANNFSNFMFAIAEDLLKKHHLSFDLLKPLIEETTNKLRSQDPHQAQTGPARRDDKATIQKHLEILKAYPEYQHIYKIISEEIKRKYHK